LGGGDDCFSPVPHRAAGGVGVRSDFRGPLSGAVDFGVDPRREPAPFYSTRSQGGAGRAGLTGGAFAFGFVGPKGGGPAREGHRPRALRENGAREEKTQFLDAIFSPSTDCPPTRLISEVPGRIWRNRFSGAPEGDRRGRGDGARRGRKNRFSASLRADCAPAGACRAKDFQFDPPRQKRGFRPIGGTSWGRWETRRLFSAKKSYWGHRILLFFDGQTAEVGRFPSGDSGE